ncbi:MAG: putative LPS assembly protein LptD [Bacteroidia bacterium]|nr:putative LPS assembly protein LptD [Bacteroidia bacterium]
MRYLGANIFFFLLFLLPQLSLSQTRTLRSDSLHQPADSVAVDSLSTKEKLTAPVFYTAKDSMVFTKGNMGYLYGDADVKYGDLAIKGEYITMDLDSNTVSSTFGLDSVGKEFGYPVFTQGGTEYEMKKVRYNFDTGKAFISNVITQQGEGYIVANTAKKNADNSFYMVNAKYTTCDLHDHPHFYLNLSKAKVRPQKDVVTGPAWLVVADVPLFPIVLPFAFFPFTEKYSSGIIMPSYGDEMERGFYLQNGGYYFAINDYVDLALTGEIYTKGTWGVSARSTYVKRYKYRGSVNASYLNTVIGDKGLKDLNVPGLYSVSKDFRINWTHSQDPKANMYRTFSASVNFSTSRANLNDLSRLYSREASSNTKSSSVSITQRFPDSPWNLTASMNINQVSSNSTISATLPDVSVTMARINPFKRKKMVGSERWYEKIAISYSGQLRNSISTTEERFLKSSLLKDWQNEIRHNIPVSATFSLFNSIQVTPSFNYSERWHTSAVKQAWDPVAKRHVAVDTIQKFKRIYDYNTSVSMETKLYGMYIPWKMFGDKIQAIRHVFSPSISFNYRPDFTSPRYNFIESYNYVNENNKEMTYLYSPYGSMPGQKGGSIGFNFKNNLEMKVKSESDSTGFKKISLIDNLDIGFDYNMTADSMRWSVIRSGIRLKIATYTLNLTATWEPYMYALNESGSPVRVNKLRILNGKGFGRLASLGFTVPSLSINQDTFGKWFGKKKDEGDKTNDQKNNNSVNLPDDGTIGRNPHEGGARKSVFDRAENSMGEFDDDGYLKNKVNWNLNINYTPTFGIGEFDKQKMEFKYRITHHLGISGAIQPTKNWNFTFNTDYNFEQKKFTNINCSLTRNLHCWSMSASFIPIGPYKSYNFVIRANASMLQDLKWEERSTPYDRGMGWY